MKRLIFLLLLFPCLLFSQHGTEAIFNAINLTDSLYVEGKIIVNGNIYSKTYGSDSTITDAELLTIDDGAATQIIVGGGVGSVFVWGVDIPTAVTIGTKYIYRADDKVLTLVYDGTSWYEVSRSTN